MTTAHKWTYDYSPATRRAGIIDATGYSVVRPCLSGRMAALIVAEHNRTVDSLTELAQEGASLISEALTTHIYDEDNGDEVEDDCPYTAHVAEVDELTAEIEAL